MSESKTLCAVLSIERERVQRMVSRVDTQKSDLGVLRIEAIDAHRSKLSGPANAVMRAIGILAENGESGLIAVG